MKHWQIGLFLCFILLVGACQSDTKLKSKPNLLTGKWILEEGFRGGKQTETLNDTYFIFETDKMSTNLPLPIRGGKDTSYTLKENIISQQYNSTFVLDYQVQELTTNRLQLSTSLNGWEFVFVLKREI